MLQSEYFIFCRMYVAHCKPCINIWSIPIAITSIETLQAIVLYAFVLSPSLYSQ